MLGVGFAARNGIDIALIVLVPSSLLHHGCVDSRVTLEISFIEDALFDAFKYLEGADNRPFLTHVDPFRTRFDLLYWFVLLVELLVLEVDYSLRRSIGKHLGLIYNRAHLVLIFLIVLPKLWIMRDQFASRVVALATRCCCLLLH